MDGQTDLLHQYRTSVCWLLTRDKNYLPVYHRNCWSRSTSHQSKNQIFGRESRFLPTSTAFDSPLGGPRLNIAMTFGTKKWCGYLTVKIFWTYVYSFQQNIQTWQTPHDGIGRTMRSIVRQKYKKNSQCNEEFFYNVAGWQFLFACSVSYLTPAIASDIMFLAACPCNLFLCQHDYGKMFSAIVMKFSEW